jgi:nicotinamide mononucleotide (NMN) deamidase PncC
VGVATLGYDSALGVTGSAGGGGRGRGRGRGGVWIGVEMREGEEGTSDAA